MGIGLPRDLGEIAIRLLETRRTEEEYQAWRKPKVAFEDSNGLNNMRHDTPNAAACGVVSWVLLTRPNHEAARITSPVRAEELAKTWRDRVTIAQDGMSHAEIADVEYANLQDPKLRLEQIRWVGDQEWASHKTPVLPKALIVDTDEAVQL